MLWPELRIRGMLAGSRRRERWWTTPKQAVVRSTASKDSIFFLQDLTLVLTERRFVQAGINCLLTRGLLRAKLGGRIRRTQRRHHPRGFPGEIKGAKLL
ncbi:hypothetical protein IMZ48_34395 [Candidatus Bathyarchaeota archaeon]|nr:hypothetical protein [Candidatus Bathyarchaeota archaeon]